MSLSFQELEPPGRFTMLRLCESKEESLKTIVLKKFRKGAPHLPGLILETIPN